MFAKVAIDVLSNNLKDTFTYHIPEDFESYIQVGSRIAVSFGVRKILGYVVEITEDAEFDGNIKDIEDVLDYSKELQEEQVEIAKFISSDTNCYLSKSLDAMIPSFLKTKFRRFIRIIDDANIDPNVFLLFKDKKKLLLSKELLKEYPQIKKELDKKTIALDYDLQGYGKSRVKKFYKLNPNSQNVYEHFDGIRKDLVIYLNNVLKASLDDIKQNVGCSQYLVNALVKQEILNVFEELVVPTDNNDKVPLNNIIFTGDKKNVKDRYDSMSNKPYLFYCNDDSFAMDFYLDICIDNLKKEKKVLIVTPTLLLNYQYFHYIKNNLMGYSILNFSSDMSNGDYYDNYLRLTSGDCDVCVTTKIGAFLPLDNIGCIIVVDEPNFNYISEQTPKYNTVEVMKFRARYHNCKIILASNPLTIDNYYNYFQAKYNILKYVTPITNNAKLVNMYDEAIYNRNVISRDLESELRHNLNNDKMSLLILNSKGYSNYLVCPKCGKTAKCPKCNIPMTYYKEKNEYKCRYCGMSIESILCDKCNCKYEMYGLGLELVKEKVEELFPNASILLIDSDKLKDYNTFTDIIVMLESKQVDIVIGTNNALSLNNYAKFSLVGLIACDNLLNSSDYRASYNTFSIISNALKISDVVIQGYNLDHYAIKYGITSDFVSFYQEDIKVRESFNYSPYYEINRLIITGDYKEMYHAANYFKKAFNVLFGENLCLGPTYSKFRRGVSLILKHKDYDKVIKLLTEVENKFSKDNVLFNFERYPRTFL